MRANRQFIVLMSWAVLTLLPVTASAQVQGEVPVEIGQEVWITINGGKTIKGQVLNMTPDSIEVQSTGRFDARPSESRIAVADIRRVQKSDSLKNGAGTGAAVVGLLGGLLGAGVDGLDEALGGSSNGSFLLLGVGVGAVAGAAIGAGLDAIWLTTTYNRPESGTSIGVRPIVSAKGKGVGVQVRW